MVRKIYHNTLHVKASAGYVPYQDLESKQLLLGFMNEPRLFEDHIKRYANSQTTQFVFGFRTTSIDDPSLKAFFQSFEAVMMAASNTGAAFLDLYPILRHLPDFLLPQRAHAKKLHEAEKKQYGGHWFTAKEKIENGTIKVCIM